MQEGAELASGEVIGERYRVEGCLGRGGSGTVYAARHTWTHRPVALKVLRTDRASARGVERFLREARIAGALQHENLVDVLDMGMWSGRPYLVLERLEGETLGALLERAPLSHEQILAVARPVVDGLAALHDAGVVHRDVKPDNVFLHVASGDRVIPKLLDLGISKRLDVDAETLTHEHALLGTPRYMSPEQIDAPRRVGPPSDVWSMGVLLAEACTGRRLFAQEGLTELLRAIAQGPPVELPADVPAPLRAVLERALARDLERRHPDARVLGDALAEAARSLGYRTDALPSVERRPLPLAPAAEVATRSLPATDAPPTPPRRLPRGLLVLGLTLALAVGAVAIGVSTRDAPLDEPAPVERAAVPPPPAAARPRSPVVEPSTAPEAEPAARATPPPVAPEAEPSPPPPDLAADRPSRRSRSRGAARPSPPPTVELGANRAPIITD